MSIIPGIENGAPERTDTSSGSASSPSRLPMFASSASSAPATSSMSPSGSVSPRGHVGLARLGRDREARAVRAGRGSSSRRGSRPCRRAGTSAPCRPPRRRTRTSQMSPGSFRCRATGGWACSGQSTTIVLASRSASDPGRGPACTRCRSTARTKGPSGPSGNSTAIDDHRHDVADQHLARRQQVAGRAVDAS